MNGVLSEGTTIEIMFMGLLCSIGWYCGNPTFVSEGFIRIQCVGLFRWTTGASDGSHLGLKVHSIPIKRVSSPMGYQGGEESYTS